MCGNVGHALSENLMRHCALTQSMCEICRQTINGISVGEYGTATGKKFRVTGIVGDKVLFKNEKGSERFVHRRHMLLCLHWLAEGKLVDGVGGSGSSIRSLIGQDGALTVCNLCDRNVAYVWGMLAALSCVHVSGRSLRMSDNEK
jgi:hypothetical protein